MTLFPHDSVTLKICGITTTRDAEMLVNRGVHALGANFFPKSKRFLSPATAHAVLAPVAGQIVRVGVFVNADGSEILQLFEKGLIDVAQLHGDESPADVTTLRDRGLPVIKALAADHLEKALTFGADALLIDTPAGTEYGGTGKSFDWTIARRFREDNPSIPLLLAGGITPENAVDAISAVHPSALDIASGAESSPGIKDEGKVISLMNAAALGSA